MGGAGLYVVPWAIYGVVSTYFTGIVLRRLWLDRSECLKGQDRHLQLLARLGLLVLSAGTCVDNWRTFAGGFMDSATVSSYNVFWLLQFTHTTLSAIDVAPPLQLLHHFRSGSEDTDDGCCSRPRLSTKTMLIITYLLTAGCATCGFYAFSQTEVSVTDSYGIITVTGTGSGMLSLVSVFAFCYLMIAAAFVLSCREGFKVWGWLVVLQLAGLAGQALLDSFGSLYEAYGSNFWEQIQIGSTVIACGIIDKRFDFRAAQGVEDNINSIQYVNLPGNEQTDDDRRSGSFSF